MAETEEALLSKGAENCPGCRQDRVKTRLFVHWMVVLCNALTITAVYPFLYFMIRDFHVAKREADIGYNARYVASSFMIGRALSSIFRRMVAGRCGRKPVIILCTVSVVIFNILFGLSTSFWMAISMRFLLGCFNGLIGPIKAYATEICREEHQALALSIVSTSRGVGYIIGPTIGGFLAQPAEKYPSLFSNISLFRRFPYLLPCLCMSIFAFGVSLASFFFPVPRSWRRVKNKKESKEMEGESSSSDSEEDSSYSNDSKELVGCC